MFRPKVRLHVVRLLVHTNHMAELDMLSMHTRKDYKNNEIATIKENNISIS